MTKKSRTLLPKRIGKVKVRKSVRKGVLADFLTSKAGQALIAEAVLAAGTLTVAKLRKNPKVGGAIASAKIKGSKAGADAKAAITYAMGEAVRTFSEALHRNPDDRGPAAAWAPLAPEEAPAPKAAKPRSRRPTAPVTPSG